MDGWMGGWMMNGWTGGRTDGLADGQDRQMVQGLESSSGIDGRLYMHHTWTF